MPARRCIAALAALALGLATPACGAAGEPVFSTPALAEHASAKPALGLFTSLPIYWPEARDPAELLVSAQPAHWARTALERDYALQPLDTLTAGAEGLGRFERLLLAQPRALSAAENVALDDWVRGGGQLLMFVDPMLMEDSRFGFGDRRRPEAVAMLSPILARWGLELQFHEGQPETQRAIALAPHAAALPVVEAGQFALRDSAGNAAADCALQASALLAACRIGRGHVLLVADATVLGRREADPEGAALTAFAALTGAAFGS